MRLTLKGLKTHPGLSEETLCFEAKLMLDNVLVGHISNRGQGGSNETHWTDRAKGKMIETWANAQTIIVPATEHMEAYELDFEKLDHFIMKMVDTIEMNKTYNRWCKKAFVFRLKGDAEGSFRTLKQPYSAAIKATMIAKYGDKLEIINEQDRSEPFLEIVEVKTELPKIILCHQTTPAEAAQQMSQS